MFKLKMAVDDGNWVDVRTYDDYRTAETAARALRDAFRGFNGVTVGIRLVAYVTF